MKKHILAISIIVLAAIPVLLPLFKPGFFLTDDGEWMIIRFTAFYQALREGQFPVRFLERLNHGYGYPVANFLYPLFMYLAVPLKVIGFGFVDAIKILIGLALVTSAVFSYAWLSRFFTRIPSVAGALVYVYTPYHLYDVYKRGSVGEILALAILPFILWQIERKNTFFAAFGIGLLLLSHNSLAMLFMILIGCYLLIVLSKQQKGDQKQLLYQVAGILLSGVGLATFFWLPAVFELSYTKFSQTEISSVGNYFASVELVGPMSFVLLGVGLFYLAKQRQDTTLNRYFVFFLCLLVVSIFLSNGISAKLWDVLPSSFIQFPFRVLSVLIIANAFVTSYALSQYQGLKALPLILFLCGGFFFSALPFMSPAMHFDKGDMYYATNEDTTTVKNEYMPKWVVVEPEAHAESKKVLLGSEHKTVQINTIYYPGWKAYVHGKEVMIDYSDEQGIMRVPADDEEAVRIHFTETPLRILANTLSVFSFLFLIGYTVVYPRLWKKK